MKTRIILTVGCVGKTYLDTHYENVYDFDKHTLEYKYDRTGFEHLTNEEFKGLPNRKINEGWFERYMQDWCNLIDSNQYDVVTGWVQKECVDYLLNKGYNIELVLVNISQESESVYKDRAMERGNSSTYYEKLRNYYDKSYQTLSNEYKNHKNVKITIFNVPMFLSEYIVLTGTNLIKLSKNNQNTWYNPVKYVYNYIEYIKQLILKEVELEDGYLEQYTQLILTYLYLNMDKDTLLEIPNHLVHDAWSIKTNRTNRTHKSLIPFSCLPTDIQDLDTKYTNILNTILKRLIKILKENHINIHQLVGKGNRL